MTRVCYGLVDLVSNLLEPHERDAVCGDLAESGATGARALRDVLGLVVRRQAELWIDWRPSLALVAIVAPVGMLLSHVSRSWADGSAIYAFLYLNNWTSAFLENPGARHDLVRLGAGFSLNCLTLIAWSWTSGYVLGSLSRGTSWVTATLFCLVVLGGTIGTTTIGRANGFNAAVFSLPFYSLVLPRLVRTFLVLIPALWGMHRSLRRPALPLLPTIAGAVAITMLTIWSADSLEHAPRFGRNLIPWPLSLVMLWPVTYVVAATSWHRGRGEAASA